MSGALAARHADKEADKGRVEQTRIKRYWAGKAPEWASEQVAELQIGDREVFRTDVAAPVIVRKADPRLARLAATRSDDLDGREIRAAEVVRRRHGDEEEDEEEPAPRPRRHGDSSSESESEDGAQPEQTAEEEEEDVEEAARRRQAVRERLIQQQRAAEAAQTQQEEDEEEEDESEYETDSDDEAYGRKLLKPVFVPKVARETIVERERLEEEEEELRRNEKKRQEERKLETREVVKLTIQAEEDMARAALEEASKGTANIEDVVTDDDIDETTEFEAWKLRELERIKLFREERERQVREAAERERVRNMTDEERRAWEAANPKAAPPPKEKKKWKYLQKYWHKGAYFQEGADDVRGTTDKDDIFNRDYSAPTGEDKYNKEILPKVMQVRNFGRSGRTKWTHLLAEDTSQAVEAPLLQASADRKRYGLPEQDFSKPKKFRT